MNIDVTVSLDKATYLLIKGGYIIDYVGDNPYNCKVTMRTTDTTYKSIRHGTVNFQQYMKIRKKLKKKMKHHYYAQFR